jgi:riboflavin synthase
MFTGIITAVGTVRAVRAGIPGLELGFACPWDDLAPGESLAVDGACLTVTECGRGWFGVNVVDTTLDRTRFGSYREGQPANLERALRAQDRLGGHWVQGHVDGIGRVRAVSDRVDARLVELDVPEGVARVSVPLGSITVDGVSLTVISISPDRTIQLSLIPFTLQHTTLGRLAPGSEVHVEGDVLGKYVAQLMAPWRAEKGNG